MICKVEYNDNLWNQLNAEMDEFGQFEPSDCEGVTVQVVPLTEFNFLPGSEVLIEMLISFTADVARDVAVGLFVNWLYNKLKNNNIDKVSINGHQCDASHKEELEKEIKKNCDER